MWGGMKGEGSDGIDELRMIHPRIRRVLPPERQHIAGASMPKMFTSPPCGRWVRKEILHKDGYREVIEMTQLPLFEAKTGTRLVIGLIEGFGAELHGEGQFHFEGREAEVFFEPA